MKAIFSPAVRLMLPFRNEMKLPYALEFTFVLEAGEPRLRAR